MARDAPEGMRYPSWDRSARRCGPAVRWGYMARNPAELARPNPQPKIREVDPFTAAEVDVIAEEFGHYGPLVVFAAETGLRPEEWLAVERRDWLRDGRTVVVERTFSDGLKPYGKTARSRRRVPLAPRAETALEARPGEDRHTAPLPRTPRRLLNLHNWRQREWYPALEAAGLTERGPYRCVTRHHERARRRCPHVRRCPLRPARALR